MPTVTQDLFRGLPGRTLRLSFQECKLTLPVNESVLFYRQRLRDEVHRFAIGAHRAKRTKAIGASPLEIPGIGPARKKMLLMDSRSAGAIALSAP